MKKFKIKWKNSTSSWTRFRSDIRVRKSHARTQVQACRAPSEPGFCTPLRAPARESLLACSLTHHKIDNSIYTLTSLYKFPIWDPFSITIFQLNGSTLSNNFSFTHLSFWAYKYTKFISSRWRTIINFDSKNR